MRVDEIMTRRPLTAAPGDSAERVGRLLSEARIHHMPLLDGDRLAGLWIADGDGTVALLGPERVTLLNRDADAQEAVTALLRGQLAVLAVADGQPAGIVTREDVRDLALSALAHGLSHRGRDPIVVRFVGPAASGKTTLLLRTIAALEECDVGLVKRPEGPGAAGLRVAGGTPVVEEAGADRMSGLRRAIAALGPVRTVFVEGRPGGDVPVWSLGESVLVVVVRADQVDELSDDLVNECGALVIAPHGASPGASDEAASRVAGTRPDLPVFVVDAEGDPASLGPWVEWLRRRILPEAVRRA